MSADHTFDWSWRGVAIPVRYDLFGANDRARVLLPALSTVSTRDEMAALARLLSRGRGVLVTDWPGFGDNPRPALDYEPDLYRAFLEALLAHLGDPAGARAVVAAGHAAAYAIDLEARRPATFAKLVLIAPTWRGPLPTVMGGRRPIQNRIRRLVQMPVLGELLYRLNVSRPVVRMMYKGHVYADPAFITSDHLARRMQLARRPGARFASACFVTGALDPFHNRESFLAAARRLEIPVLVIYGEHTPRRSRAEMDALAAASQCREPSPAARRARHPRGAAGRDRAPDRGLPRPPTLRPVLAARAGQRQFPRSCM
jgi:pimeloyl-ACP methyl ester carboxylesterase